MNVSGERDAFLARCLRAADCARRAGLDLRKAPGRHALEISREGRSAEFPIVSDERDWLQTTVEEALYAVLLDLRGAADVKLEAPSDGTLEEADRALLPTIEREIAAVRARAATLAQLLGGQAGLDALLAQVEGAP